MEGTELTGHLHLGDEEDKVDLQRQREGEAGPEQKPDINLVAGKCHKCPGCCAPRGSVAAGADATARATPAAAAAAAAAVRLDASGSEHVLVQYGAGDASRRATKRTSRTWTTS